MKSYEDSFLDPTGVAVSLDQKTLPHPERITAGLIGVLRKGEGLGTGESYISVVLLDSLLH